MKKITSFLMMLLLCCTSVFAQGATEYVDKLIRIGTVQTEMVPGKWYFLHTPRNRNQNVTAEDYAIDGVIQATGGLVYDNTSNVSVSPTTVIDELTAEEGVSSNDYLKMMVRFVAVDGEEGAYNIQFGTGRWIAGRPIDATCTNNQYIAGEAGKYNFYLPTIDGIPNSKGRFGWNEYNMQQIVDNNGAGATVAYWSNGELTQEAKGWTTEDEIAGNNVWEIFDVKVVGDVDKWAEAVDDLINDYNEISSQGDGTIIENLIYGENVGSRPGNYRPEDVEAFLAIHFQLEELLMLAETEGMEAIQTQFSTPKDLKAFNDRYVAAWHHLIENKVPQAMTGIEPGYYTFSSVMFFYTNKSDSVVPAPKKSLYSAQAMGGDGVIGDWLAWGTQEPNAAFLWKVEAVEGKPTEYRMINMWNGKTHISIGQSSNSRMELNDTATVCFDFRNDSEEVRYMDGEEEKTEIVTSFNIRSSQQAENAFNYLHCGGHSGGAGTGSWILGWSDGGATRWYMTPVDEATANQWLSESEGPKTLQTMITKGDSIAAAFPAQLEIAKDLLAELDTTVSVANADNFESPFTCTSEGDVAQLFDGITNGMSNFWHSEWNSGSTNAYSTTDGTNYFVVHDTEGLINGALAIVIGRRPTANDHIVELTVYGTNEDYDLATATEALKADSETKNDTYTWTKLGVLKTPYGSNTEDITSNAIEFEGKYKTYKFLCTVTSTGRGYFHMSEFRLYPATVSKRYATTQYDVRKAEAEALSAAIAVWEEKEFDADSLELLEDETFIATYNTLVAAAEAWGKVYVDPTALREAIANTPNDNLFVIGDNPGQWKEGTVTPGSAVAAAEAYNASGAYTPAESEAHIAALSQVGTDAFAQANPVETGKWYRFKFPTEECFDTYGWDKAGAKAVEHEAAGVETQPALFGKTLAIGKKFTDYVGFVNEYGGNDTIAVNSVEEKEEWFEGDNLCFFEDAGFSNGEDLFRFIQATDSSFMIQNKATGLFLRAGYPVQLSAVPSYFSVQAMGAGANLIASANVLGGDEQGYSYLHAERLTNTLTTWNTDNLGSNSMIMIEEVEPVTEEPSTEYYAKLWPGQVYAYTYPVDVTISDGATAYAAGLAVTGNRSTVVLQPMENATIKAGTPFVMIANPALAKDQEWAGEYISSADRLKQIASEILAENGQYGRNEQALAKVRLNDEYAIVTMNHGMTVSTNVDANYSLRGTMEQTMVEAGKAILPNENGFGHTFVNKSIAAYGAWIASDFDPESEEVLGNISIMIGEIGDSIVTPDTPDDDEELPVGVALITDASQLSSPFTCTSEGSLENLIDGNPYTYWHSEWQAGQVDGGHYLQLELAEPVTGKFSLYMKRRSSADVDHPTVVRITGSETSDFETETLNILLDMPNATEGAESRSEDWVLSSPTKYIRIEATDCESVFRGYWHAAELQIYKTGAGKSWAEIYEGIIASLADYPAMQAELQSAYDECSAMPEDSVTAEMWSEVHALYRRIKSAISIYAQLPALIAQADSVLADNTDAELLAACEVAREINAQSSTSEQITVAYETLSDCLAPYLSLSVPMDQWNFTYEYNAGNGLLYRLDPQHGLACARLKLAGEFLSLTEIDVPEYVMYDNKKFYVVAMKSDYDYESTPMLQTLGLPSSLKYMYDGTLGKVQNLKNIIIDATTAPSMDNWQGIEFNRLKVTIPNGSINSYSLSPNWSSALLVQETPVEISLALSAPGELRYQILDHVDYLKEVNKLTITSGNLNTTDWKALAVMTNLIELDIEACANTFIPENQFSYSHLETVKLPAGLKEIKYGAFQYSHRLASVVIPDSVTYIHGNAFHYCSSLKDVVLNEGLTEIDYGAFYMCDITSLTIPSTVKRINNDAFAYNYRLKELNLNEGLECIIHNAFNECDSLTEVVLPSTLTMCYIPFANCDNLTCLTSNALVPAGTDNYCPVTGANMANVVLKVPVWSLDEYKFAPGWSQIPQIVASEYQPENIVISKDFTLRIKESEMDASYRPNVALKWSGVWSYDNQGNGCYERGNLTTNPGTRLNARSFSMFYSHYAKYYDEQYWSTIYNPTSLLVKGSMRADNVTITLMHINSVWQFISFPFEVRMSDIVPVDPNTVWVVREYSGAERANGNMDATWMELTSDDVLKAGKGYIMHCYSEKAYSNDTPVMFQVKPNGTSLSRQNIFLASDAEVVLEEHIAEFEHNGSWNLIGNPYPCYYDTRFMDFNAPITVWNSNYRNYVAYSPLDDDYVLYPGEAFFVQRPVEQESIVFYADGRQTDRYAREMANARKSAIADRKVYNIVLKGEKTADRTRVVLNEKASMAYEMNCDASKFDAMSRDASQIFTVAGNARMAINERPMGSGIVELGVVIASEGVYTIALKQAGEKKVVLEDRKLGVCTVLSADNEYTFSAVPGEAKGRFFLNFDESATGIDGIGAGQTNKEPAYNTAGVRVEDGQKGLVIKEGKKIVNK